MKTRIKALLISFVLLFSLFTLPVLSAPSNTSFATASNLTSNLGNEQTINGLTLNQSQWFYVSAAAGQWLYSAVYNIGSGHDWDLYLYNSAGNLLASSYLSGNTIEYIGYTVSNAGNYYFQIRAYDIDGTSSSCTFKAILSNGISGDSTKNNDYCREDAEYYLYQHWNSPNTPTYPYFTGVDCANFVSQAIEYGGMSMLGNSSTYAADSSWYINLNNFSDRSLSWAYADILVRHWGTYRDGVGYKRGYFCKYYIGKDLYNNFSSITSSLHIGDIVVWTTDSNTKGEHALMVYDITDNDVILAAHSDNTISTSLKTKAQNYQKKMFIIIRIKCYI